MRSNTFPSIHALNVTALSGRTFSMSEYTGKVLLIVNTASKCGHTYQLGLLEELYQEYKDRGLVVIGFPSDQFAQEPLNGEQIQEHCQVNYGVTFPMMAKSKVRGDEANAVFKFFSSKSLNGKFSKQPRWNFYKFLVGRNGEALDHFWTYRKPNNAALRKAIERALMATNPK
ncbi:MAG TPA: glutathione peroxidase [Chitinophagales bacterium]|nr:glutathione peroxidase [Chitinophagales bacterium]HMU68741.1 glutathione peroxidase [Chitinophagales bacterium]HMX03460.1 glutathione peroxidase [Chitinophagales bacterium]HMZ88333.1 glutathione peroxidase [Chitinophagales bacterium]HNA56474.1 glutathione peroxidase [Chitinophagales bacterium]